MNICVEDYLSDLLDTPVRPHPSPKAGEIQVVEAVETLEAVEAIEMAVPFEVAEADAAADAVDAVEAVGSIQIIEPVESVEPVVAVPLHAQPDGAVTRTAPVSGVALPTLASATLPPSNPTATDATPHPVAAAPAQSAAVALLHRLADQDASRQPERRAAERATRWLRMRCDEQHYAVELLKIQEVVLPATLLPLRGAAAHMLGVMNLRGQIVPVIDLGLYLGRAAIIAGTSTRIVVVEEHGETLGLLVSAVEDVAKLTDAQIEAPESTRACGIDGSLFRGVARAGGLTVILLDATSILK